MKPEEYTRSWTDEQWADAEQVESEAVAMLGEDGDVGSLIVLVIEERKIHPATTVKDVASLAITLGVETMLSLRHAQSRNGCNVLPDVAKARAQKRAGRVRRVRGV